MKFTSTKLYSEVLWVVALYGGHLRGISGRRGFVVSPVTGTWVSTIILSHTLCYLDNDPCPCPGLCNGCDPCHRYTLSWRPLGATPGVYGLGMCQLLWGGGRCSAMSAAAFATCISCCQCDMIEHIYLNIFIRDLLGFISSVKTMLRKPCFRPFSQGGFTLDCFFGWFFVCF